MIEFLASYCLIFLIVAVVLWAVAFIRHTKSMFNNSVSQPFSGFALSAVTMLLGSVCFLLFFIGLIINIIEHFQQ